MTIHYTPKANTTVAQTLINQVEKHHISLSNEVLSSNKGRIVCSSEWSRGFTPVPWKIWRFSDRSSLLVSTKGCRVI